MKHISKQGSREQWGQHLSSNRFNISNSPDSTCVRQTFSVHFSKGKNLGKRQEFRTSPEDTLQE